MMPVRRLLTVAALVGVAACTDDPAPGPGTLTVTVRSPAAAEGAALLDIVGTGIGPVGRVDGPVFSQPRGDTVRVLVVNEAGGPLRFSVEVADTTRKPEALLVEVAGADDRLHDVLKDYSVEVRR